MFLRVSLDLAPGSLLVKLQLKIPSWTEKTTVTDNFHTLFLDMLELSNIDQDSVCSVTSLEHRGTVFNTRFLWEILGVR